MSDSVRIRAGVKNSRRGRTHDQSRTSLAVRLRASEPLRACVPLRKIRRPGQTRMVNGRRPTRATGQPQFTRTSARAFFASHGSRGRDWMGRLRLVIMTYLARGWRYDAFCTGHAAYFCAFVPKHLLVFFSLCKLHVTSLGNCSSKIHFCTIFLRGNPKEILDSSDRNLAFLILFSFSSSQGLKGFVSFFNTLVFLLP